MERAALNTILSLYIAYPYNCVAEWLSEVTGEIVREHPSVKIVATSYVSDDSQETHGGRAPWDLAQLNNVYNFSAFIIGYCWPSTVEVIRSISEQFGKPILVISSYGTDKLIEELRGLPETTVISAPCEVEEIRDFLLAIN